MKGLDARNIVATTIAVAAIIASGDIINNAYAKDVWVTCSFNSTKEDCSLAGSPSSFTVTFRSDRKQISVEKVGSSHECSDGSSDSCGKVLITELKQRRTTWASFRQTPNEFLMRSSRGNSYRFPL
jgi:hypothetical protein